MNPSRAPRVTAQADAILHRTGLFTNPYFTTLADGSMSKDIFRATQEQFFFAVRHFPRPMAALISRMPDPALRLDILRNLVEEHGEFRESQFHQNTFHKFLTSLGGSRPDLAGAAIAPAVHAFNCILMAACATDELDVGICCMGIVEKAFADISAMIGKAVVERGWVPASELVHYNLHTELDVRHADEFFAVVESGWDHPPRRIAIEQGLELGAYAFDQLYHGLLLHASMGSSLATQIPW